MKRVNVGIAALSVALLTGCAEPAPEAAVEASTEEEFNAHVAELVDESKLQYAEKYHSYADMLEILDNWG